MTRIGRTLTIAVVFLCAGVMAVPAFAQGDVCGSPLNVPGLPFTDAGSTCSFSDDYAASCDGYWSAPDLVYAYTPVSSEIVDISLANSDFDTTLYVYEDPACTSEVACDDDGGPGPTSVITGLALTGGNTYYIVVDAYDNGECGNYVLDITRVGSPPGCPPDAAFSQPPSTPSDIWGFAFSDVDFGTSGMIRYEDFFGLAAPICGLTWYGSQLTEFPAACAETTLFEIAFYPDSGGLPGPEACSYSVPILGVPTGVVYYLWEMQRWHLDLTPHGCCELTDGWISIRGLDGDTSCLFAWATSGSGFEPGAASLVDYGEGIYTHDFDLSLCLTEGIACPDDITETNDTGQCGAVVYYETPPGATCEPASGSFFDVGETEVTCTVGSCEPLTHSTSLDVEDANSIICTNPPTSYWRAFDLSSFGVTGPFVVESVDIGIHTASTGGSGQLLTVNLYTNSGAPFPGGTQTLIGTNTVSVPDQSRTIFNIPVAGTAPAGSELVVEVLTPAQVGEFWIGANNAPETSPSYMSGWCSPVPLTMADWNAPWVHVLMAVNGTCQTCTFNVTVEDTEGPNVVLLQPNHDVYGLPSVDIPIRVVFSSEDNCSSVVHEAIKLSGCTLYDGDTYGDRDGLLSDEGIQINKYRLCQAMAACHQKILYYPKLQVEATDASGNTSVAERIIRRRLLKTEVCR